MDKRESKIMRKRLLSAYVSSVLSISLVLLLVGVATLLLVNSRNVSDYFKENMKLSVVFHPNVSEAKALKFQDNLLGREWVNSCEYISQEQGIREMKELLGEDFLSVFETSPIPVSLNVSLQAEYVDTRTVDSLVVTLLESPVVEDVVWQKSLVDTLNSNMKTASLVLGIFVLLLLFISIVLINNTVRLNIYSKRFTIHTMRLVGATKSFILRPFLQESLFQGVISALLSIVLLLGGLLFVKGQFAELFTVFQLKELIQVMLIVIVFGVLICTGFTFVIVNHMVSLKKQELYY